MKDIQDGRNVLVVSHGSVMHGLVYHLDKQTKESLFDLNAPEGAPIVYELNEKLEPIDHYYLVTEHGSKKNQLNDGN